MLHQRFNRVYVSERKYETNAVPYEDQLQVVQKAITTYKEQNGGILPIKTRDMSTPIYQKYPIDFQKNCSALHTRSTRECV